jgi:hypothetical protein
MDSKKLIPFTDETLKQFRVLKEDNQLKTIYLQRWIEYKRKYFSNFLSYAFDEEGNLYRRDFLSENGWLQVAEFDENDLRR